MREATTPCCRPGEQTRYIRCRPAAEWGNLKTTAMPRSWLTIIGEVILGMLLAVGVAMLCL